MSGRILIVEDDRNAGKALVTVLKREGHEVTHRDNGADGLSEALSGSFDLVLSDIVMPGLDGMSLFRKLRAERPDIAVIMMTAHGTIKMAVEAMHEGATDFLEKPLNIDRVRIQVNKALTHQKLESENRQLKARVGKAFALSNILGEDPAILQLVEQIRQVAPTEATVLIEGESGTGKELVANALHELSHRNHKPFIKINCAALPDDLLSSELFGHAKGAFTGANTARKGRFEEADGGTLFLDEIGDLPPGMQVKLLRVLQEGTFERVGDNTTRRVDVRLVTATHVDLEQAIRDNRMREDFYYRIKGITLNIPALRDRRTDIPLLTRHFLNQTTGNKSLDDAAMAMLQSHPWPGNIRQLKNICDNLAILSQSTSIGIDDLPIEIRRRETPHGTATGELTLIPLAEMEEKLIRLALEQSKGNKTKAAQLLGIGLRTLYRKLDKVEN